LSVLRRKRIIAKHGSRVVLPARHHWSVQVPLRDVAKHGITLRPRRPGKEGDKAGLIHIQVLEHDRLPHCSGLIRQPRTHQITRRFLGACGCRGPARDTGVIAQVAPAAKAAGRTAIH
jgi:hypothetical protein